MIKGVFGLSKLTRWFKCIILDKHEEIIVPPPTGNLDGTPSTRVEIYKCRYCGRTCCDYK